MLVIDGIKYKLWTLKDEEKEFHPMIREHSKEIFGEHSLYFDVHHKLAYKLKSKAGIAALPDAYVITLSKPYYWFVVENELSTHPVYSHMVPQLMKFVNGIKNSKNQKQIVNLLHREIVADPVQKAYVEKMIASPEIYRFLSNLVSDFPRIVIIVEKMTGEIREACAGLPNVQYMEFKTFVSEDAEDVRAHMFEPLFAHKRVPESREKERKERKYPPHRLDWEKRLEWVDEKTRLITEKLMERIPELGKVTEQIHGRNYCYYKRKPSTKSIFVALILTKKKLNVRIRTDLTTFKDPKKRVKEKVYKGWFFKTGQEREFMITEKEQIDYAMKLIQQSYESALPKESEASLSIMDLRFLGSGSKQYIEVWCKNTGKAKVTIVKAIVFTVAAGRPYTVKDGSINPNALKWIRIGAGWASGYEYTIELVTASGDRFKYTEISPR